MTPGDQDTCQKHPQCTTASSHSHGLQLSGNRFCSTHRTTTTTVVMTSNSPHSITWHGEKNHKTRAKETHTQQRKRHRDRKKKEFRKRARQERGVRTRCPATTAGNCAEGAKTYKSKHTNGKRIEFFLHLLCSRCSCASSDAQRG